MVPLSFAGHDFVATSEGALFWPAREALLVADLHLEKASWFARLGQFLPPYDSHATLLALQAEVNRTGATRLYCLGDSFHDKFGCDRLPEAARSLGKGMREMRDSFQGGPDDDAGDDGGGGGSDRQRPDDPIDGPQDDGVDDDASFDELGDGDDDEPGRLGHRERESVGASGSS